MRKFLFLSLLFLTGGNLHAQVTIAFEDFEDGTVIYTTSTPEFSDNSNDYFFNQGSGSFSASGIPSYTNVQGSSAFVGEDLDGEGATLPLTLNLTDVDVTNYSSLQLSFYLGADQNAPDLVDSIAVYYTMDAGTKTRLTSFRYVSDGDNFNNLLAEDTNGNGVGDGTNLSTALVQFTYSIPVTGNELDIEFEFALDAGSESFAIDNIQVTGTATSISLTSAAGYRLLSATSNISYSTLLDAIWTQGATTGADATNGSPNVYEWNNTSSGGANTNWTGQTDLSNAIVAGEGFMVYVYADDDFDGNADAFPKTLTLNTGIAHSEGASPTVNSNADSWTLLGNPFNETIDFDNLTTSDITGTAYIWDPNAGGSGEWETWNGSLGDITDGLIAVSQGFFVQTVSSPTSASVSFPSGAKSSGGTFYGKATEDLSYLRLEAQGSEVSNSAWIQLSEEGSLTEKVKGDALELEPLTAKYAQLGFNKGEEVFDIAHINFPEQEITIPITFNTTVGGDYTLTVTHFAIPGDLTVFFHDYDQEISIKVDDSFSYNFTMPQLKAQDMPPLNSLETGVIQTKVEGNRFSLTIRPTSVNNELDETPLSFGLAQNYPNPFNPSTTINYTIEHAGAVNLSVYNLMGQRVATLVSEAKSAGTHSVRWNAAGAASGMYYYRLEANGQSITRKMTLIK